MNETEKKRRGRPRKGPNEEGTNKRISFWVTPSEKEALTETARSVGMAPSALLRWFMKKLREEGVVSLNFGDPKIQKPGMQAEPRHQGNTGQGVTPV